MDNKNKQIIRRVVGGDKNKILLGVTIRSHREEVERGQAAWRKIMMIIRRHGGLAWRI